MGATATDMDLGSLITRSRGIKRGTPHVSGTGVTVRTVVRWYKLGLTAEEIVSEISHLTLAQVYAALAYYHLHQSVLEKEMADEQAESDQIEQEYLRRKTIAA